MNKPSTAFDCGCVHLRQRFSQGVSSPIGLRIASELRNQEICGNSRFRNASIKSLLLRRQQHGNLNQSHGIKLQSRLTCTPRLSNASLLIGLLTKFRRFLWGETNLIFRAAFVYPRFHISDIDLLIRMDLFWNLIRVDQVKFSDKQPTLQKTRLD